MKAWDHEGRLQGVSPHLIAVMIRSAYLYHHARGGFIRFTSGFRTPYQQEELVKAGRSKTMHSYHLKGKAVDVAIITAFGGVTWEYQNYRDLNDFVQVAARETGALITWGGHWKPLVDAVHFQIETL